MSVEDALLNRFLKERSQSYHNAPVSKLFILLEAIKIAHSAVLCNTVTFKSLLWLIMKTVSDDLPDNPATAVLEKYWWRSWKKKIVNFYMIHTLDMPPMCASIKRHDHWVSITTSKTGTARSMMYGLKLEVSVIPTGLCILSGKQ